MVNRMFTSIFEWLLYAPMFVLVDVMVICALLAIILLNPKIIRTEIVRSYRKDNAFRNCAKCGRRIRRSDKSKYCGARCEIKAYTEAVRRNPKSSRFHKKRLLKSSRVCGICNKVIVHNRDMTVDHIIPLSKGGRDIPSNTQLAHTVCNQLKGNSMPEELVRISNEQPAN